MKKFALILSGLILAVVVPVANAGTTQAYKIGVINVGEVLQQDPSMQATADKLKSQFKDRQSNIEKSRKQLKSDQDKLNRDQAVMTGTQLSSLKDKIVKEERDLTRMQQDYYQDVRMAQNQAMQSVLDTIKGVVEDIAKDQKYDLILQRNSIAFASERVDITKQVIAKLKALPATTKK